MHTTHRQERKVSALCSDPSSDLQSDWLCSPALSNHIAEEKGRVSQATPTWLCEFRGVTSPLRLLLHLKSKRINTLSDVI